MRTFFSIFFILATTTIIYGQQNDKNVLFNEICVANIDMYIDPSYNYGGWIELYNPTSIPIALNSMCLRHTDSDGTIEQQTLNSNHGIVPPMGYAVLWFDHNSADGYYGPYAANQIPFKLDADGGLIELLSANDKILDKIEYPNAIARSSFIRSKDGEAKWEWTSVPTPGTSNNHCPIAEERLMAPLVNCQGGVFSESFSFSVHIPEGATLYYTTDGSTPIPNISEKSTDGLFSGNTTTTYRFILSAESMLNSPVVTRTFIKRDKDYYLPVLNISTDPKHLYDDMIGIYVIGTNGIIANNSGTKANINMDWERPVNVEYYIPNESGTYEKSINQETEMSIFGGYSRFNSGFQDGWEYKPSFKLKAGKVFEGVNSFDYPLFNSKPFVKIKSFLVRNGGQDKYYRVMDAFCQELIRTSGLYVDCQAYQPSHVFLNGRYLGMLNIREESNKQFAYSNYGIDVGNIDQWKDDIFIKEGDDHKLNEWFDLSVRLADNPTDTTIWEQISNLVDIDEYCNYMAVEIYMGNNDWLRGGIKNQKGFRARDDNGRFHLVLHDLDGCFYETDMILQIMNKGTGSFPKRFCNMLKYAPFRKQFIDTYCLMNGSVLNPERCTPILQELSKKVAKALLFEGRDVMILTEHITNRINDKEVRGAALKNSLIEAFDLHNEYNVKLSSNIQNAKLLLNGLEIPSGNFDGYLFAPVVLTSLAPEGYKFIGWNVNGDIACTDSIFILNEEYEFGKCEIIANYQAINNKICPPIRINEIDASNDVFINDFGKKSDWIELYNTTNQDLDLSGIYISDNINEKRKYQICSNGADTKIPAHGYKIVWCDGKSSTSQLHTSFKLENADSACVCIMAEDESWTDSICYKAQPRWFSYGRYPDGGSSLALFERPTICSTNSICTSTVVTSPRSVENDETMIISNHALKQVSDITYYNLKGQKISNIKTEHIVIQKVIYQDGSIMSRKVLVKQ